MINYWSHGRNVDASESPLPPDRVWQAELWRRLRDELDEPDPTERLQEAVTDFDSSRNVAISRIGCRCSAPLGSILTICSYSPR
jgi:hypothetical protein